VKPLCIFAPVRHKGRPIPQSFRVLGFFPVLRPQCLSPRPNWDPFTPPHPQASVPLPPLVPEGTHLLSVEGVGGPNSDEGTDTVVL
jgi:hypothetical protein